MHHGCLQLTAEFIYVGIKSIVRFTASIASGTFGALLISPTTQLLIASIRDFNLDFSGAGFLSSASAS